MRLARYFSPIALDFLKVRLPQKINYVFIQTPDVSELTGTLNDEIKDLADSVAPFKVCNFPWINDDC